MESDKPKRSRNNYFQGQRKIMSLIFSLRNRYNAIREQENGNHKENETTEIIKESNKSNWAEKWTARGTVMLAIITGFLAWYTYQLFEDASTSTQLAKQTHSSDSAFANRTFISDSELANKRFINDSMLADKRFQSETATINKQTAATQKMYELNKISFDSSIKANQRTFQQQIDALNETRKDFEIANQPFLEIKIPVGMDSIRIGLPIILQYDVRNLGKYPVKIISEANAAVPMYNQPSYRLIYQDTGNVYRANGYITYDSPINETSQMRGYIDSNYYNSIMYKRMPIYLLGYIKYLNLVNGKKREYDYMIQINFWNPHFVNNEFIINDNKDIP